MLTSIGQPHASTVSGGARNVGMTPEYFALKVPPTGEPYGGGVNA